ncbi:LysR family transcriptional regulator [Pararhizobium gei]|uniref:LysR family transcriptional regulator n=1 Tax=Pararhizobium gei TaxID=1395951 RepID=UPI0023DA0E88|nr:LysR family transcriptional regulator [Rhizobium gei]
MELSDLRVFRTVVEAGGITRAAERLHRVQSNVTTRIKKLEDDLGVELFAREGKRLHLTSAGTLLLTYAEQMLVLAERAREAVTEETPRGLLRLGAMESTAAVRLPRPLTALHRLYPEINVELRTGASRQLTQQVLAGELDAALIAGFVNDPRLEVLPTFAEELVVVANATHGRIAQPSDVKNRAILAFRAGCHYRQRLEDWFAKDGVPVERIVEVASYHAILGCAAAGMGVAMVPRSVLDGYAERAQLSLHDLDDTFRLARTSMIWRKDVSRVKIMALGNLLTPDFAGTENVAEKHHVA